MKKFNQAASELREKLENLGEVLRHLRLGFRTDQLPLKAYLHHAVDQKMLSLEYNQLQSILAQPQNEKKREENKPKEEVLLEEVTMWKSKFESLQSATLKDMQALMKEAGDASTTKGAGAKGGGKKGSYAATASSASAGGSSSNSQSTSKGEKKGSGGKAAHGYKGGGGAGGYGAGGGKGQWNKKKKGRGK